MKNWIPMRWPGGQRSANLAARQPWLRPESLKILDSTPINCLVVDWAAGTTSDKTEQAALAPLIAAARQRNIAVVGTATTPDIAPAKSAGLSALIAAHAIPDPTFPILPVAEQETLNWNSRAPISVVSKCVWPSITRPGGDDNLASGPTQAPWIASNGWFTQLARASNPSMQLWLEFEPPAKPNVVTAAAYSAAILDSENQGARWILTLDDTLRDGLITGTTDAVSCWRHMARTLTFFRKHADWHNLSAAGVIGILSDFAGPNQYLAFELLNLTARRQIPYRVLAARSNTPPSFDGLKAIVSLDEGAPSPALKARLDAFLRQGGLVLAGSKWPLEGQPVPDFTHPRFTLRRVGQGRLAVCKEDAPIPTWSPSTPRPWPVAPMTSCASSTPPPSSPTSAHPPTAPARCCT